jgi:hypothetical protein
MPAENESAPKSILPRWPKGPRLCNHQKPSIFRTGGEWEMAHNRPQTIIKPMSARVKAEILPPSSEVSYGSNSGLCSTRREVSKVLLLTRPSCPTGKSLARFRDPRVQPLLQKYFPSRLTQISSLSRTVPSHRGAIARRHERGAGCGGRKGVRRAWQSQGEMNLVSGQLACEMIGA